MLSLDCQLANNYNYYYHFIYYNDYDYNHYEIIQRKRYGGGAKLFRTLLMFLSVSSGIDCCYWPYGQMRLSTP